MSNKFDSTYIKNIAEKFSEKIVKTHFSDFDNLVGNHILDLTESKQVNLFILLDIFSQWQTQLENSKSEYFDYDSVKVKEAFKNYSNEISKNIKLNALNAKKLIINAASNTILIHEDPNAFFTNFFNSTNSVNKTWLSENKKFFTVYTSELDILEHKLELGDISKGNALETINSLISEKSNLLEKEVEYIILESGEKPQVPTKDLEPSTNNQSFFDSIASYKSQKSEEIKVETINTETLQFTETEVPKLIKKEDVAENLSLNDLHKTQSEQSLSNHFSNQKVDNIKNSISLNQKYLFINQLFDGNPSVFEKALSEIENCGSVQEVTSTILNGYQKSYAWNMESPEVEEFMDLIKRKFKEQL